MAGFRILRADTAFSNAPSKGQKRPRIEDGKHLAWLRTLPCVISGRRPVEAAHIRFGDPVYGKRETGGQERPSDMWCLPVHPDLHREQHSGSEKAFWAKHGIDPCRTALALYAVTGDDEQGEIIIRNARKTS